jgi:uncharacterized protein YjcR
MAITKKHKYKAILRAAKFILEEDFSSLSELSDNQLIFLESLSIFELSRSFIESDLLEGRLSFESIANKYGVSKSHVRDVEGKLKVG